MGGVSLDIVQFSPTLRPALTGSASNMTSITVDGGKGNDLVDASEMTMPVTLNGGGGSDTLIGGAGPDVFIGGSASSTNMAINSITASSTKGSPAITLTASFSDSNSSGNGNDKATIVWGDGSISVVSTTNNSTLAASHIY